MTQTNNEELKLKQELLDVLEKKEQYLKYNKFEMLFPDEGSFKRDLYPNHLKFMAAGAKFNQRAIIAANRTGKTLMGAYELTCHLTGLYPKWWEGRRFKRPIEAWAASIRNEDTKNILQKELLGDLIDFGTGLIPKHLLGKSIKKPGVAEAIETQYVAHVSGGWSRVDFKAYEQGRDAFQGTKKQVIWLDEEPRDASIYSECLTRTADKHEPGMIYCTFTPLMGLSDVVLSFLPGGKFPPDGVSKENPHKFVTRVEWEDVPHLDEGWKQAAMQSYSRHELAARTQGIPHLGSGAIYPFLETEVGCEPKQLQPWWPRAYALDVGWNRTAALWAAKDPDSGIVYIYSEHYMGEVSPAIHASAIKARGDWIEGVIDPASRTASQSDGRTLLDLYEREGLLLQMADHSVEAGILKTYQMLETGQIKIFNNLANFWGEYRVYHRDEKGRIVKKNDHLMDALRYLVLSGLDYLTIQPDVDFREDRHGPYGADAYTGY